MPVKGLTLLDTNSVDFRAFLRCHFNLTKDYNVKENDILQLYGIISCLFTPETK